LGAGYAALLMGYNLLDPVQGASHFAVSNEKITELQHALRETLPGYLVPKFVKEIPHDKFKKPFDLL
jgi:L-lysine 2,3-aminomutase